MQLKKRIILSVLYELGLGMKTLFWRSLVLIFVLLGFIRALLPGMPTTVFLILAAWATFKGWPQMDAWLLNHPKYGATLRAWRENGTVPRKAKWFASIMMFISAVVMLFTNAPLAVKIFTDVTMLAVAIWLWLRPEPESRAKTTKIETEKAP